MRVRSFVLLNFKADRFVDAQALFRRLGRQDLANAPQEKFGYSMYFEDDTEFARFRREAEHFGFGSDYIHRREHIYTKGELRAAPLLDFIVDTAPKGSGGPTYGTEYDLSKACPHCGTGAIQVSPLYLKSSGLPKRGSIFQTLDGEDLVSGELADALRKAEITGLELRQARSRKDKSALPWWQLVSKFEMPPTAADTTGIVRENPCPQCGQDGYFNSGEEPTEIKYANETDPALLPDVVHTFERFGNGIIREPFKDSHIAYPLTLVKPRVLEVFEREKVRGVKFEPVQIVSS